MINLTSDTLTRPTQGMLQAMMNADVGDDVFGEDPTVNKLEGYVAERFGMQSALFCPSGTMANQIALKVHTRPLDEVICDINSHVYQYEVGGYAFHSGIGIQMLEGDFGRLHAAQIEAAIRPEKDWLPSSRLVVLENTCNRGGGSYYTIDQILPIREVCKRNNLALHLDGARLFNALVETSETTEQWGAAFDSISLCLSKGLGAPVGSMLIGSYSFIKESRRVRKAMGGGMRQVGYLAAAGIYALGNHVDRLKEDHLHAQWLSKALEEANWVTNIKPVSTNIILFDVNPAWTAEQALEALASAGIKAAGFGPQTIRFVTHLDVTPEMALTSCRIIKNLKID